jgi:Methyltransferase domain
MLGRLQRKAAEQAPGATVLRAPAEDLPFEDATFDVAVSTLVLCGVDDQPRALRELRRVLGPAASCCSSSTCAPATPAGRARRTALTGSSGSWSAVTATARRSTPSGKLVLSSRAPSTRRCRRSPSSPARPSWAAPRFPCRCRPRTRSPAEEPGLSPDRVGHLEPAQVMDQPRTAQDRHVIAGITGHARRRAGQVGHPARVAGQAGALHVDQVGHRLQDLVQVGPTDPARQLRLGAQDRIPIRRPVQAVQQLGRGRRTSPPPPGRTGSRGACAQPPPPPQPRGAGRRPRPGRPAAPAARAGRSLPPAGGWDSPCRPTARTPA